MTPTLPEMANRRGKTGGWHWTGDIVIAGDIRMSQDKHTTTKSENKIRTEETPDGIRFFAYNQEHGGVRWIGTMRGGLFQKAGRKLRKPEPGFAIAKAEMTAIVDSGARVIQIIDEGETFSIDVDRFQYYAVEYFNSFYGSQWFCRLGLWDHSAATDRRNNITDNPAIPTSEPVTERKSSWRNLDLFSR
jgi:hypothetical protein